MSHDKGEIEEDVVFIAEAKEEVGRGVGCCVWILRRKTCQWTVVREGIGIRTWMYSTGVSSSGSRLTVKRVAG